ncbi:MAG: HPr family phosphocarrier protein [Chloroflexi bacterium]|nr:HPr family phosphocarrier protein [Chloroflexota bacterium]
MDARTLTILDPSGLHTRPAARFVQVASRFASRIVIRHGDREADAKSLIALLGLTIRPESVITLEADGPDAPAALAALIDELAPFAAASPATATTPATAVSPAIVEP